MSRIQDRPQGSRFRRWYQRNRKTHNASRAARYAADPRLRAQAQARARAYRKAHPQDPAPRDGTATRVVGGVEVLVWRLGRVAGHVGVTDATLRAWERAKMIPAPTFEGRQRVYTPAQADLLRGVAAVIKTGGRGSPAHGEALARLWNNWQSAGSGHDQDQDEGQAGG